MPKYEPFDWYQTPVFYDMIFDVGTPTEADFLEQCHTQHATPPTTQPLTILEPACGSGRLMAELAARGHQVVGVDLSTGMLDFARKRFKQRGVTGTLVEAPMQDFDLHDAAKPASGYDLAHILVSSFKYLQTEDDALACIRCICDHLRVGGVFVLGIHLSDPNDDDSALERWRAQRDGLDVICTIRTSPPDRKHRTEQMRTRIVARDSEAGEPKRYETNWTFRTYTPSQLRSLFRKEPRFKHMASYTFDHNTAIKTSLAGDDIGVVLVLRRES